jgi:hypothetical protein
MRVLSQRRGLRVVERLEPEVSVVAPVGAVVTDTGLTFGLTPLHPFSRPIRVTCTQCSWQVAVVGLAAVGERARRHAAGHDPVIAGPSPGSRLTRSIRWVGAVRRLGPMLFESRRGWRGGR